MLHSIEPLQCWSQGLLLNGVPFCAKRGNETLLLLLVVVLEMQNRKQFNGVDIGVLDSSTSYGKGHSHRHFVGAVRGINGLTAVLLSTRKWDSEYHFINSMIGFGVRSRMTLRSVLSLDYCILFRWAYSLVPSCTVWALALYMRESVELYFYRELFSFSCVKARFPWLYFWGSFETFPIKCLIRYTPLPTRTIMLEVVLSCDWF